MRLMTFVTVAALLVTAPACMSKTGPTAAETDEAQIIDRILTAQRAGLSNHDVDRYLGVWASDATLTVGRIAEAGPYDVTMDRSAIEKRARLNFSGQPSAEGGVEHIDERLQVHGKTAVLEVTTVSSYGQGPSADYDRVAERFDLVRNGNDWQIAANRYWLVESRLGGKTTSFDAAHWADLDAQIDALLPDTPPDERAFAYRRAFRFQEAFDVLEGLASKDDAEATLLVDFGWTAVQLGRVDVGKAAYRRALAKWPEAPVPPGAKD